MTIKEFAFKLGVSDERLLELGASLGADIPFCITGGTVLARGIGEKLRHLSPLPKMKLLIVKPKAGLSTKMVYESLDIEGLNKAGFKHKDVREMVSVIESDEADKTKIEKIAKRLDNILEVPSIRLLPLISDIKQKMLENNCLGALMSGSGTAIFGIYENDEDMQKTKEILERDDRINYIQITNTL